VRFEVLTTSSIKKRVFWDISPCSLAGVDRLFIRAYCVHHQGGEYSTRLHGTISQKTLISKKKLLTPKYLSLIPVFWHDHHGDVVLTEFVWEVAAGAPESAALRGMPLFTAPLAWLFHPATAEAAFALKHIPPVKMIGSGQDVPPGHEPRKKMCSSAIFKRAVSY
jgi:hypothetical protein